MKNLLMKSLLSTMLLAVVFAFASCEKDEGKLPDIAFKTSAGYTSSNTTAAPGAPLLIGVTTDKTEDKDVLKTLTATVSYDGGAPTELFSDVLTGTQGDHYEKDLSIVTRNQTGTESYIFTVINRDGLTNSVSLTVTVQ